MAHPSPQPPANYRLVPGTDLAAGLRPYRQLAWVWVYFEDQRAGRTWSIRGTGVFLDEYFVLTCAHIFALNAAIDQVVSVSVHPGHNSLIAADAEPLGGLYADTVYACRQAFPQGGQQNEFNPGWDLALICLARPAPPRQAPPFMPYYYEHIGYDPAFQGNASQLMTVGYGTPDGMMIEANLPLTEAVPARNWLEADRAASPGQSGSPIFYQGQDQFGRSEFRLVGIISCDNKDAPQRTIGTMITNQTRDWINRVLATAQRRTLPRSRVVPFA